MTEVTVTLAMPVAAREALQALAAATGAPDLGALVQDATRTYEWLLWAQDAGLTVVLLTETDMQTLAHTDVLNGPRDTLAPLRCEVGQCPASNGCCTA